MLPEQTENLINEFVEQSKTILKDNLVGIYLHGSAVMGCFNPSKSDLDLIVVVERPISDDVKRLFMDMVIKCNSSAPAKGIEMSIVLKDVCKPFIYPTPFELHFSKMHLKWYEENPEDYISKMKGEDKDLAAHFTILIKRGRCLYGASIEDVFDDVPANYYMDSILDDVSDAPDDIAENTMYLILNLARVLAYKEEQLVLSKKEGGEWALEHLSTEYKSLIETAMTEYLEGDKPDYDMDLAKRYAEYMTARIKGQQGMVKKMNVIETIKSRHSYRGTYKPDKVPREDLTKIMQAGLDAPSGCNKQTTSLICVDDSNILKEIHAVINPPIAETAPAMICVLTKRINAYRDKCFAIQDYSAAIENMLLAIVELGYQSCWFEGHITDDDRICDKIAKILNVPEEYDLVCVLPVGIAENEPLLPRKKEFSERAWFNSFMSKE